MSESGIGDRKRWEELYAGGARPDRPPSAWVSAALADLPNVGLAVDIAGGSGRHAILAARAGWDVVLLDIVPLAIRRAMARDPRIRGVAGEVSRLPLAPGRFGLVLVTNFLDRDAMPGIVSLVAPGGTLVYETYTIRHLELVELGLARGPQTRAFLLRTGELPGLCQPLEVIAYQEGEVQDDAGRRRTARIVARRGTAPPD